MQARVVVEKIDTQGMKKARACSMVVAVVCVVLLSASTVVLSVWAVPINSINIPTDALFLVVAVFAGLSMISFFFASVFSPKYRKHYGMLELENGVRIRLDELTNADLDGLVAKASHIKLERNQPGSV